MKLRVELSLAKLLGHKPRKAWLRDLASCLSQAGGWAAARKLQWE